jgi:hypothetical protein
VSRRFLSLTSPALLEDRSAAEQTDAGLGPAATSPPLDRSARCSVHDFPVAHVPGALPVLTCWESASPTQSCRTRVQNTDGRAGGPGAVHDTQLS